MPSRKPKEPVNPKHQAAENIVANTSVAITIDAPSIHIKAETPHLILRPVTPEDVPAYQAIYSNPQAMALFHDGTPKLHKNSASKDAGIVDYAQNRMVDDPNSWCKRWAQGNPFSAMTMLEKSSNTVIGQVVIGGGEMAYFIHPDHWGNNYGTEAALAMCKAILPSIVLSKCASNIPKKIEATAHTQNIASWKILETIGMSQDPTVTETEFSGVKYPRKKYEISVDTLVTDYLRIKTQKSTESRNKKQQFLPLYQLHQKSTPDKQSSSLVNIGGYNLRNTEQRKLRHAH